MISNQPPEVLETATDGSGFVDVRVCGELEMQHAPLLRESIMVLLDRGDVTGVNLDLGAVTLLDATGAGVIIVTHRIATNRRVSLRITAASGPVRKIMTLVGAAGLLPPPRGSPRVARAQRGIPAPLERVGG